MIVMYVLAGMMESAGVGAASIMVREEYTESELTELAGGKGLHAPRSTR